ncbi:DUF1697 domain-containing protein [Flavobacterium sp. MK4S-17]|uniref:DUF1697 domain-containing protein n=1 Tax=Flavobacterium sp. MK4S-17 TaxID=2543737 RepID=UPI00135A4BA1|nr:DUF1697 domain-containing protein [Flavobacterium sp. MK4S-17]
MPVYLALLRGINVSGQKLIKMADLRMHMEAGGYKNVQTYIQSGNIVFKSESVSSQSVAKNIERLIKAQYGFDVTVFVYNKEEIEKAVDSNPFITGRAPEPAGAKKLYVTFLNAAPLAEDVDKLKQAPIGNDRIAVSGNILYFKLAESAATSKLSNNLIENKLRLRATTRNWNTTLKLLYMLSQ